MYKSLYVIVYLMKLIVVVIMCRISFFLRGGENTSIKNVYHSIWTRAKKKAIYFPLQIAWEYMRDSPTKSWEYAACGNVTVGVYFRNKRHQWSFVGSELPEYNGDVVIEPFMNGYATHKNPTVVTQTRRPFHGVSSLRILESPKARRSVSVCMRKTTVTYRVEAWALRNERKE